MSIFLLGGGGAQITRKIAVLPKFREKHAFKILIMIYNFTNEPKPLSVLT